MILGEGSMKEIPNNELPQMESVMNYEDKVRNLVLSNEETSELEDDSFGPFCSVRKEVEIIDDGHLNRNQNEDLKQDINDIG